MTRIDMRSGAWRKIREARKVLQELCIEAIGSSQRVSEVDRGAALWWKGRAHGLRAADDLLWSLLQAARAKRRRAKR